MKKVYSILLLVFILLAPTTIHAKTWQETCVVCGGRGEKSCDMCRGLGKTITYGFSNEKIESSCKVCGGDGISICPGCWGKGYVTHDDGGNSSSSEGGSSSSGTKKKTVNLTTKKKTITLTVGDTQKLTLKGKKVKYWTSSKKSVATVSSAGLVKAKKAGQTNIKARVGNKDYICIVKVKKKSSSSSSGSSSPENITTKVYPTGITLSESSKKMYTNKQISLSYVLSPDANKITEAYTVTWSSSDKNVATVDVKGNVYSHNNTGTTRITATVKCGNKSYSASCIVEVESPLQRLYSFMNEYGYRDGNSIVYQDGGTTIAYDGSKFTATVSGGGYFTSKTELACDASITGVATIYSSSKGSYLDFEATTKVDVTGIERNKKYNWVVTKGDSTDSDVGDYSVPVLISSLNCLLSDALGFYVQDIGFTGWS